LAFNGFYIPEGIALLWLKRPTLGANFSAQRFFAVLNKLFGFQRLWLLMDITLAYFERVILKFPTLGANFCKA